MVDVLFIGIGVAVLLALAFMTKTVLDAHSMMKASMDKLDEKLVSLEDAAKQVNADVSAIRSTLQEKVDRNYVEKRLDGLVALVKKGR
ncbi:hypothetical protein HZC09_02140 [Candidatus Micrarchaeota archaeon]|nr:hypothetical protein [Candidatus Micrarchaeota archaeon]